MEWISIVDRYPDYSGWYLVYSRRSERPSICYFVDMENQFYRKDRKGKKLHFKTVTHWMHLPDKPTP